MRTQNAQPMQALKVVHFFVIDAGLVAHQLAHRPPPLPLGDGSGGGG